MKPLPEARKGGLGAFHLLRKAFIHSSPGILQDNEAKRMWFASILFIAKSLHGGSDEAGLPLTKILQEFSIW